MRHPLVMAHGPEHHFLVPAVLLTVAKSSGCPDLNLPEALTIALERSRNVLGGFCGYYGACGGQVGAGIFMSILTDATPLSEEGFALANEVTGSGLVMLSSFGGPRCCKRSVFTALQNASKFSNQKLGTTIELPERILCPFFPQNHECIQVRCPYFPQR